MAKVFQKCKEGDPPCTGTRCGHPWTVRYREPGGRTGRQREKSFPKKKQADAFAVKVEDAKNEGVYLDPNRGKITIRVWVQMWLKDHLSVGESTYSNYRGFMENWVVPELGKRTLAGLETVHVQRLVNKMREKGLAASTIADRFNILYKLLNAAIRDKRITENVCEGVSLPRLAAAAVNEDEIPSLDEVNAIYDSMSDQYKLTVPLMAAAGLRISESLAFNRKTPRRDFLRVAQQISSKANREDSVTRFVPLKHRAEGEYRDIPLVPFLADEIEAHLDRWGTITVVDGDRVFEVFFAPRERGKGVMPTASTYQYHWKKALTKADLLTPSGKVLYTPHSLRHFFASTALANNIPILEVSRWLGHKSIKVTADSYGHLVPDAKDRFRVVMQNALRPGGLALAA